VVLGLLPALAGCSGKKAREADPAKVRTLATAMIANHPVFGGVPFCKPAELMGGASMTFRTVLEIAGKPVDAKTDRKLERWVNPTELDAPAASVLTDSAADLTVQRQAAAELLAAPFYLVYRIDSVDAPMALGLKEPKRGTIGASAIRYDRAGVAVCYHEFQWQNDYDVTKWSLAKSDKTLMDPAVVKVLQDDLTKRMLEKVGALAAPSRAPQAPPIKPPTEDSEPRF
jgi:hypothetical protein